MTIRFGWERTRVAQFTAVASKSWRDQVTPLTTPAHPVMRGSRHPAGFQRATAREPITVGISDDNRLAREALSALLGDIPDVRVVDAPGVDMDRLTELRANVLLLDVEACGRESDCVQVASGINRKDPAVKVIVLGRVPTVEHIGEFVNAGVSGFLPMDAGVEEFVGTVRSVAAGAMVLPPSMASTCFAGIANNRPATGESGRQNPCLTPREHDVMSLIGAGLCNKDIAGRLSIATHTVKSHVRNILGKLALRTRLQVAVYANRHRPI